MSKKKKSGKIENVIADDLLDNIPFDQNDKKKIILVIIALIALVILWKMTK